MWSKSKVRREIPTLENIRELLSDSEDLLRATVGEGSDKVQEIRRRFEKSLRTAQDEFAEIEGSALRRTLRAARATNEYAHDHPWRVALAGMSMALMIGLLTRSR